MNAEEDQETFPSLKDRTTGDRRPRPTQSAAALCTYMHVHTPPPHLSAHHGLVVEGKTLHGAQGVGGTANLLEDDKGLAPHFQAP